MKRLRLLAVCDIDAGLSDTEFVRVERDFGFEFADDHRAFLAAGLPVNTRPEPTPPGLIHAYSAPWPDWRGDNPEKLRASLGWPVEGVLFDTKHHNGYWDESWGPCPDRTQPRERAEAVAIAERFLADVPALVPLYGHRYLPAGRGTTGHPVLSVWQTDIICYGSDLADYIINEFGNPVRDPARSPKATVPFWRDLVS